MCDAGRPFRRMHARVFLPSFCPHVPLRYIELRNWNWQARHGWGRTLLILQLEPTNSQKPGSNLFFNLYSRIYKPINQKSDAVECTRDVMYTTRNCFFFFPFQIPGCAQATMSSHPSRASFPRWWVVGLEVFFSRLYG